MYHSAVKMDITNLLPNSTALKLFEERYVLN